MKKLKMTVDILMLIFLIISLVNWHINIVFHVVTGSLFAALMILHIVLNFRWLKGATKTIFKGTAKRKIKLQYVINIILLSAWLIAIITGIITATMLSDGIETDLMPGRAHTASAIAACLLTVIHIIQHRKRLAAFFKKRNKTNNNSNNLNQI